MLNLFKKQKKDPQEIIKELFSDVELPSFPTAIMEMLATLRNPDSTPEELIRKVECDPGLTVKVLRTVNSAAFGLPSKIEHIGHAVSLLGRARLESVVLSIAVNRSFSGMKWGRFNYKQYWHSAARRAFLASHMAEILHPSTKMESFTEGLLQDMGVLLLFMKKKDEYVDVYERWQNEPVSLGDLEHDHFGFDHTEVGAIAAKMWQLPDNLVRAIERHHEDDDAFEVKPAIRLVSILKDSMQDDQREVLIDKAVDAFNMDRKSLMSMIELAYQDANDFQVMLGG